MYQTVLRFAEGCNLAQPELGILAFSRRVFCVWRLQSAALPIDVVHLLRRRFDVLSPSADFQGGYFYDRRLCGLPEVERRGLAKMSLPQADAHNGSCFAPATHACTRLYAPKRLVEMFSQFVYDGVNFVAAHLTSLPARFQKCSQNSVLRFRLYPTKSLAFGAPLGGL